MDLRFPDADATDDEIQALDALLGDMGTTRGWQRERGGAHHASSNRPQLLAALHALQDRVGWISPGGLGELSRRLDIPPAEAYGVATFYAMFALEERPHRTVHVCADLVCQISGAGALMTEVEASCGPPGIVANAPATWIPSPCLGLCERAPAVLVTEAGITGGEAEIAPATAGDVAVALRSSVQVHPPPALPVAAIPQATDHANDRHANDKDDAAGLVLLKRVGVVDPLSLDSYLAHGGYDALRAAVAMGPDVLIREVTESNLVGRGGAVFPTGRKWAAVAAQSAQPHYLVCNADESEPGTFKDRVIIEGDPFSLIEAMTIAGFVTGAELGYLYIRGEYPRARETLRHAIEQARGRGFLGDDVLGMGFAFDIEFVRGAGAYICGEETAIFNSIEGFRGEPRSKPPYPVEVGLFGKPTVVNNVETLVNVLPIALRGGKAFAAIGTSVSAGTKLFCMSGSLERPGVYEVPFGATLREMIELAGGVRSGRTIRAVLLGGAAGSFVRADELDVPLTIEGAGEHRTTLGSGVVMVLDDLVDIDVFLRRIAAFFRDESCGQCVPCRVGTVRQEEALVRLTIGPRQDHDLQLIRDVGLVMRDASICGLGQTAWSVIESAIDRLGVLA